MIKYIFFDAAGTLIWKPLMFERYKQTLMDYGNIVNLDELKVKHKLLSEVMIFPNKTNEIYYKTFNGELLCLLGIVPNDELLNAIFKRCTYLPWEKFEDTKILSNLKLPIGIISNFNSTLKYKINHLFGPIFSHILVSEELEIAKPDPEFYIKSCKAVAIQPENILYIGDSLKLDVQPALKIGMKPLLIDRNNYYTNSKFVINSLQELYNFIY